MRHLAGSRITRATIGALDQVAYSLTNFLVTVLVARQVSGTQFGAYAVLYSSALIGIAVNRGIAAEPLVIRYSATDRSAQERAAGAGLHLSVGVGVIIGLLVAAGSATLLPPGSTELGLTFAAAVPVLIVQDYVRYVGLALRRPMTALTSDLVALALIIASAVLAKVLDTGGAELFVIAWGTAELGGAVVGLAMLRLPSLSISMRHVRANFDLGLRLGADNFATQLTQQGAAYAVASLSGLAAAAGLRAAQTALTPIAVLTQSLQTAVLPELVRLHARGTGRGVTRVLVRAGVILAAVSAALVVGEVVMPRRFGTALLGGNWTDGRPLLVLLGVGTVAGAVANTAVLGLRVFGDAGTTLRSRSVAIGLTLVLVVGGAAVEGARGAAIGIAVAAVLQTAVWWVGYGISYRRTRRREQIEAIEQKWRVLVGGADPSDVVARLQHEAGSPRA